MSIQDSSYTCTTYSIHGVVYDAGNALMKGSQSRCVTSHARLKVYTGVPISRESEHKWSIAERGRPKAANVLVLTEVWYARLLCSCEVDSEAAVRIGCICDGQANKCQQCVG